MKFLRILIITVILSSCNRASVEANYTDTKLIAHRGNGAIAFGLGQSEENNLSACEKGFRFTDGVEIDVQRSNDYVVYLYLDITVDACGDHDIKTIAVSTEDLIEKQFDCIGEQPTRFKTLLEQNVILEQDKDIFVDVKTIAGLNTVLKMPTPQHYLNLMAQDLFELVKDYPYQAHIPLPKRPSCLPRFFLPDFFL